MPHPLRIRKTAWRAGLALLGVFIRPDAATAQPAPAPGPDMPVNAIAIVVASHDGKEADRWAG